MEMVLLGLRNFKNAQSCSSRLLLTFEFTSFGLFSSNLALVVLRLLILDTAHPSHSPCLLLRGIDLVGNVRGGEDLYLWNVIR